MMHAMNNPPVQPAAAPEHLTIAGPAGKIEAVIDPPEGTPQPVLAIVCHPLPTEGGTMHNKVVTMTARALRESGVTVLRFNFRGVGACTVPGQGAVAGGVQFWCLGIAARRGGAGRIGIDQHRTARGAQLVL